MQKFFTSIQLCYNTVCNQELVPWTHEFEELPQDAATAILGEVSGNFQPGLYIKKNGYWALALNYDDLCVSISQGAQLKVVVSTDVSQSFQNSPTLYRNGYKLAGTTITPGPNTVWVIATPTSGDVAVAGHLAVANPHAQYALAAGLGNAATKDTGTTTGTVAAGDDARLLAVADKVDKIAGKGLSTEDYSTAEKEKLTDIEAGATVSPIRFTATKALATTAAASLPDDTIIEVAADESLSGARTRYKVAAGALVFVVNLDQLQVDLADASDPAKGAALVGYDGGNVQDVLDDAKPMSGYSALRAYAGRATGVRITTKGIAGIFQRDVSDTTSTDNGGTIIVDALGRRWKRNYSGPALVDWWGAVGTSDDGPTLQLALDFGGPIEIRRHHTTAQKLFVWKEGTRLIGSGAAWGSEVASGARIVAAPTLVADYVIEFKNPVRGAMRSVGMENIGVDCGTADAGGIVVRGAYDASEFKNLNIINVPVDKVGFTVSAGNTDTREGPVQTTTFKNIFVLHRAGGVCTKPAVVLGDMQECTVENIKGSHSSNDGTAPAIVVQSCDGVTLISPAAINQSGYGIVVRENHGPCVGVTIITPTYEKCKQPLGTDSKDTRMFGTALPVVAVGSILGQPADGSTASGTVWQSTASGVYVKDTVGVFAPGVLYDSNGDAVMTVTSLAAAGNSNIRHINPRTISVQLSGVAQSVFSALSRSEIDLPMDTQATPIHTHLISSTVQNSTFREMEWGVTTNNSTTSRVESMAGEVVLDYPARWSITGSAVNLADYAKQGRIRITKNGGAAFAITISGAGISIGKYGVATLTIYEGHIILQRSGPTNWEIAAIGGTIKASSVGMICGIPSVAAITSGVTFDSTLHERIYTNAGATGQVVITANPAGISSANTIGTRVRMVKVAAQNFLFDPSASDTVLGASGPGKYVGVSSVGDSITLECVSAATWAIIACSGTPIFEP